MTQEELVCQTREEILTLLREVKRPGMDKVIWYLENSDFFRARCNSHHKFRGGLAVHSLGVFNEFKKLDTKLPEDSIRIVSFLHDICKAHLHGYNHIGKGHHGLRSVMLLDALGLKFETGEYYAIEKHSYRISVVPKSNTYDQRDMLRHYLHQCDHRDAATYPDGFDSYTPDEKKHRWYRIDTLLYSTHRLGIEIVLDHLHKKNYLGKQDAFYNAPASVKYHNNTIGGLAKHSLDVYREAKTMYEDFVNMGEKLPFGMDSIILCSLLHDVCKMDEYEKEGPSPQHTSKWVKNGPHGVKSLRCLKRWHLELSKEEQMAIIWHMGNYAKDAMKEFNTFFDEVATQSHLVKLIHEADSVSAGKK